MRLKIVIATMVVLFPFAGTGQTYFNELLPDTHLFAFGNILTLENGYIINGSGFNPTQRTFFTYDVNQKGKVKSYLPYGAPPKIYFADAMIKFGSGYVTAGDMKDSAGSSVQRDPIVVRYGDFGNILWTTRIERPRDDIVRDVLVSQNKNIVFAGAAAQYDTKGDYYIGKVDSSGNLLFQKTYGEIDVLEECRSVIQTNDGGFVLSGVKGPTGKWDIWVVRTDSAGEVIWEKNHGSNFHDYGGHAALTNDGNMAMAYATTETGATEGSQLVLSKIDIESGDTLFRKQYEQFVDAWSMAKPVVNADGTMVIAGGRLDDESGRPIGLVIKTSPFGEIIWSREYFTRSDVSNYIYDIKGTLDSGYVFCGSAFAPEQTGGQSKGWIVKLDCHGNDSITYYEPDSACVVYSNITYYQSPINEDIKVFPNPATDYVTVEFPQGLKVEAIELINATGQSIFCVASPVNGQWPTVNDPYQLPTTNYPAGLYWLKVRSAEGIIFAKKLVLR